MPKRPTRRAGTKKTPVRKRPSRRKKKPSTGIWPFLGLIGLFLVLGSILFYLYRPPHRIQYQLNQKIDLLDKTIKSRLFELGFSKKDILSRQSRPRMRDKLSWRAYTIKVQLPKGISFPQIKREMKKDLTRLDKDIRLRFVEESAKPRRIDVRVGNLLTHNIIFYPPKVTKKKRGPRVAIVIDDLGSSRKRTRALIDLDASLTLSFFPLSRNSRALAQEASEKGKEVMLHMPMEPYGFPEKNPGKGALLMNMNERELHQRIEENLEALPFVKGVNNHMGSRFMEDDQRVSIFMEELRKRELYFLDSRTTAKTLGYRTAKKLGIKTGQRNLFLDNNSNDETEIRRNIQELAKVAKAEGKAIAIGHPHPSTIKSLREMIPRLRESGIEIVPLSEIMD
ncbi:MAG: divergent polysaccharide deacetylase family protein [Thermodesulfobacteriota bacterium]